MTTVYTIGHSNRQLAEFLGLLEEHGVTHVVDVRKLPGSKRYPQFNAEALAAALADHGIQLSHSAGLTGRRLVSKTVPKDANAWWRNRSFHNYADHALGEEFTAALHQLRDEAARQPTAIMCSEAVWWRCHRRIIADYLLAYNESVVHIMGPGQSMVAELSAGAVVKDDGTIRYP